MRHLTEIPDQLMGSEPMLDAARTSQDEVLFILEQSKNIDRTWDGVERRVCSNEAREAQKRRYEEA
jgi:hypothetical protein